MCGSSQAGQKKVSGPLDPELVIGDCEPAEELSSGPLKE